MLRRVWHVLALLLLLTLSINAQTESTTVAPSTTVASTTEKNIETTVPLTTTTVSLATTVANVETTTPLAQTTTSQILTTTNVQTTQINIGTTQTAPLETTKASEPSTSTVIKSESTTNVPEAQTTKAPETTTVELTTTKPTNDITTNNPEVPTTKAPETTTVEHTTTKPTNDITTNVPEVPTTKAPETTSIEQTTTKPTNDITTNVSEVPTTKAPETTTVEHTTTKPNHDAPKSLLESPVDIESTTRRIESDQGNKQFSHAGKPQWAYIEPSEPIFPKIDMSSSTDDFAQKIILQLAEYISSLTNGELSDVPSSLANVISDELRKKLDQSGINLNNDDRITVRATAKVLFKDLPAMISAIISNIDNFHDANCPVKFTFLNRNYCMKAEINLEAVLKPSISSPTETTTISSTKVSVKTAKVFKLTDVDTPPLSWQRWFHPSMSHEQSVPTKNEPVVVCYYTNWAQYRNGPGRFYPENIDPNLCTHIVYAFAQLTNDVIAPYEWNDESTQWSTGMFARMMNLRKSGRPKILLALGGWNHGSERFSDMVHNETKRATFVTTTIIFLQKHKFDGLDLDWEYPGSREGSRPTDKDLYTKLLIELKTAFRPYSLLLTAAVGAGKPTIDAAYNIPKVCENLDLVNLMSYDLHGSWETQTGIHVPLYGHQNDTELNKQLTQDWAVRYWISNGCPPSKLVMGLALYGRTFRLASSSSTKIGAPTVGPGSAGLYTGEAGFLAYYEICNRVQQQGWTTVFDDEQKSNYAYKGQEWVGYDDINSIGFKVRYAKDMGLAGIMFWAPDLDDFTGTLCNQGKYPLMNTGVNLIRGQSIAINPSIPATVSTTTTTSTGSPSESRKRAVCYYTNWAQYRPEGGKFFPENLDTTLCTHIIYAFAVLNDSKLVPFEWNDLDTDWSKGMYARTTLLKKSNDIKVLLAVGGWNFGSGPFSDMVGNEQLRKGFVQQATKFLLDQQFDGLDLDWEYPGSRDGSRSQDKQLFTALVKELKVAFKPYNLLLTAAVGAGSGTIENGYEIDKIAPHLDFINLMTYDLHGGAWENVTGFHTALYARPEEDDKAITLNQNWAVNYWIQQGMPKEKITMGLAMYGRTFKLVDSSNTGIGAPSSGPGDAGNYTGQKGFLSYYEICEKLQSGKWTSKYDDIQKSMYAYGEGMWVGYDNIDTLTIRANYIIGKDLGGVMIWAPDLDDFSGKFCNRGRYPLMNTVINLIRTGIIVPIVIPTPPTTTATTTEFTPPPQPTPLPPVIPPTPLPPVISPTDSPPVDKPSRLVVCMTTENPLVFQTLDSNLCTHLIIVQSEASRSKETDIFQRTLQSKTLERIKLIKQTNSKIKILYSSLGEWNSQHLTLIRNNQLRQAFNQQIYQYLIANNLDGLDIDWNIQPDQISSLTDKYLLSTWLSELKSAFTANQLILSISISGDKTVLDNCYEFSKISSTVDFIRLLAFDWTSKSVTGLVDPLFYSVDNKLNDDTYNNINWVINYVLTLGVPPEQLSIVLPTYGRLFFLADANQYRIGSPTTGSSIKVAYSDLCKLINGDDYVKAYDEPSRSSYVYNIKKKQWISYDTVNDVALKARFAKLSGIGGVTLSSIGMDDINGQCRQGPYPLLRAVAGVFDLLKGDPSVPRDVDGPTKHPKLKNILCSVSSNVESYYGSVRFTLDKIDARLCSHLLIDNGSSLLTSSISDQLKATNVDLKILLTLYSNNDYDMDELKNEMKTKKADGINIVIDVDTFSKNITDQIKEIRQSWSTEHLLTISIHLPTDPSDQVLFFQIIDLHKYADLLIILPFDGKSVENFNVIQPWNSLASFIQANTRKSIGDFSMISVLLFVRSIGVPHEKLIMSIPTYGLSFLLEDENKYQIGDRILGDGLRGPITHTKGMLASYEICKLIQTDDYERLLSNQSIIVMAHHNDNLIIFDDTQPLASIDNKPPVNGTVELKASFIKNSQLAGVHVSSIDMDDYTGLSCNRGAFPITSTVYRVFFDPAPTTQTTVNTETQGKSLCLGVKTKTLIPDENDSHYYYVCVPNNDSPMARLQCPNDMLFSSTQKACTQQKLPDSSKSVETNGVPLSPQPNTPFTCPSRDGIFPNLADCTHYFACSNNQVFSMACPTTTKFNSKRGRCDWSSDICP